MTSSSGRAETYLGRGHVWAVGDIHGARLRLRELLLGADIVDKDGKWSAGAVTGVCVGDYLNRGEDGAGVVVWLRQLQQEARAAGGDVIALVGNHDVLMCGVLTERQHMPYGEFAGRWLLNGGRFLDLERLEQAPEAEAWLRSLPAMTLLGDTLYLHSDTIGYAELGTSVEEVNVAVQSILQSGDLDRIASLFDLLCRRGELRDPANVEALLERFGGSRIVHGHSPIFADRPAVSHGGRSVNIEGALWESDEDEGLGFIYWPEDDATL
jgi:hypothetical protein